MITKLRIVARRVLALIKKKLWALLLLWFKTLEKILLATPLTKLVLLNCTMYWILSIPWVEFPVLFTKKIFKVLEFLVLVFFVALCLAMSMTILIAKLVQSEWLWKCVGIFINNFLILLFKFFYDKGHLDSEPKP